MTITISIDDLHPQKEWGLPTDNEMKYLKSLWEEFGAKFTLFIPSNYHQKYPISKYKDWIDWLLEQPYFELAAHGHFHECNDKAYGEMEFAELQDPKLIQERINIMCEEWDAVDFTPSGWRNPGWIASPQSIDQLQNIFDWVALHEQHNQGRQWNCKMIFGHVGIHESNIPVNNDIIMFQSHINGRHNSNRWSKENYERFRNTLQYLKDNYKLEFKILSEL